MKEAYQMLNVLQRIEIFFQPPDTHDQGQEVFSTLYLLRRDICTCFGIDPNNGSKLANEALFPATMGIMAGIDLLSKFVYLDDETGKKSSRKRFMDYVVKYIEHEHSEALYHLRNSLLHSFGLYSRDWISGQVFKFILDRNRAMLVEKLDDVNHIIDIGILWKRFEESVATLKVDIQTEDDLKENFQLMYDRYGVIGMRR